MTTGLVKIMAVKWLLNESEGTATYAVLEDLAEAVKDTVFANNSLLETVLVFTPMRAHADSPPIIIEGYLGGGRLWTRKKLEEVALLLAEELCYRQNFWDEKRTRIFLHTDTISVEKSTDDVVEKCTDRIDANRLLGAPAR